MNNNKALPDRFILSTSITSSAPNLTSDSSNNLSLFHREEFWKFVENTGKQ